MTGKWRYMISGQNCQTIRKLEYSCTKSMNDVWKRCSMMIKPKLPSPDDCTMRCRRRAHQQLFLSFTTGIRISYQWYQQLPSTSYTQLAAVTFFIVTLKSSLYVWFVPENCHFKLKLLCCPLLRISPRVAVATPRSCCSDAQPACTLICTHSWQLSPSWWSHWNSSPKIGQKHQQKRMFDWFGTSSLDNGHHCLLLISFMSEGQYWGN